MEADRDVEKSYSMPEFIAELRRLADALEAGGSFEIEIDGEQVVVPTNAVASIEHEREDGRTEIEFQLVWGASEDDEKDGDDEAEGSSSDESDGAADEVPASA